MYLPHFYLSIHLSRDTSTLVTVNNAAANMGVPVICFKSLLAILLGPYPEMELLMKHIFVPLKGICCLCFGLQHLHQNQKKKSQNQFGKLQSTVLLKQKAVQRVPQRFQKCQ